MGNYIATKLDAAQVVRRAYDEAANRLRVDAEITASIGDIILSAATSSIAIGDGVDTLAINPDGTINVNVLLSHVDDSVRLGDGTTLFTGTTVGPKTGLDVNLINTVIPISAASLPLPTGAATESTLGSLLTELQQKTEPADVQNIRLISSATDSIDVPGVASETTLASIDSKLNSFGQNTMANSMPVVLASDQTPIDVALSDEPIKMSGTENGQPNGIEFTFVNNLRLQILDAKDRDQDITYADFGTKDQRIIQIDYNAPSIGVGAGFTARQTITYTLVGTKYRRDSITWTLI